MKFAALTFAGSALANSAMALREDDAPGNASAAPSASGHDDSQGMRIQQVIDLIIRQCVDKPIPNTVDTVKTGDPSRKVEGIVTTFMATREVIEKAIHLGANLIITHEPTFWNHTDDTQWLKSDHVYLAKRRLLDENGIVIWRCHDYWHSLQPDPVNAGLLKELGWAEYADAKRNSLCTIPPVSLRELAVFLKSQLKLNAVQMVGNPHMSCRRVALSVGASGGRAQMETLSGANIDVVVAGDINEWEACEYVRDAAQSKMNKGYLVIGHANSEEPGMKYLAEWLRPMLPNTRVTHVPAGDPFALI